MTNLYFKNNKVLPKHKIDNLKGWKELEYNIPTYNKETHRIGKIQFPRRTYLIRLLAHAENCRNSRRRNERVVIDSFFPKGE